MDDVQNESKQEVETTTDPAAQQEEIKPGDSELESDKSKNVEEPEKEEVVQPEETVEPPQVEEPDYKVELEKARGSLKRAESTIVKLKKKEPEIPEIDEDDIAERIARKAKEQVREDLSAFRQDDLNDYINDQITNVTDSLDEAEFVRFIFDERFTEKPTTKKAILDLIDDAKYLANKKRRVQENRELKTSLAAKQSVPSADVGQSVKTPKDPKYNPTQKDYEMARQYFSGDMDRYLENKVTD